MYINWIVLEYIRWIKVINKNQKFIILVELYFLKLRLTNIKRIKGMYINWLVLEDIGWIKGIKINPILRNKVELFFN
jgi:hypothetical protein